MLCAIAYKTGVGQGNVKETHYRDKNRRLDSPKGKGERTGGIDTSPEAQV